MIVGIPFTAMCEKENENEPKKNSNWLNVIFSKEIIDWKIAANKNFSFETHAQKLGIFAGK